MKISEILKQSGGDVEKGVELLLKAELESRMESVARGILSDVADPGDLTVDDLASYLVDVIQDERDI